MTPTTLYDFTPQGNGQTAGDTISSRIVYGTDVDERGWLYESIKTSTPFRVSELTGMQFSTYVIDEEVLAVKEYPGGTVMFTLLAPQVDGDRDTVPKLEAKD